MCITFFFTNFNNPTCPYKFILINNRDEYFARLTTEAELKSVRRLRTIHGTDIDVVEHGTWLGLSELDGTIRIGNLLNVTGEIKKKHVKGRGAIVSDFIKTNEDIMQHNKNLARYFDEFNGFNFLSVELRQNSSRIFNACNIDGSVHRIPMGYHGISNSPFSTPYMKVINGQLKFKELVENNLNNDKELLITSLLNFLKCESKHLPCSELSRRRPQDMEVFSSINVRYPEAHYGTRNRSVILIDHFHNVDYIEERMVNEDPVNAIWKRKDLKISGNVVPGGIFQYMLGFSRIFGRLKAVL